MLRSPLNNKIIAALELCLADPLLEAIATEYSQDGKYLYFPASRIGDEKKVNELIETGLVERVNP